MAIELGRKVLVVEDEWLIAAALADMLADMGLTVIGPAATSAVALDLLAHETPDCALLDISLGSDKSFAVAELLKLKRVPFLFLTGYASADLPSGCYGTPFVAKPVSDDDLRRLLPSLLSGSQSWTAS